jgi:hypothetical protein
MSAGLQAGSGLVGLLLGCYALLRICMHRAPHGCDLCQGVNDCEHCQ